MSGGRLANGDAHLPSPAILRIGPFRADVRANQLLRPDGSVHLEPRVMAILVCLAERAGTVVTRHELMEAVWPDVVVGEDALNAGISKLRRALNGVEIDGRPFIETVPKVGYRLVAAVSAAPGPAGKAAGGPATDYVSAAPGSTEEADGAGATLEQYADVTAGGTGRRRPAGWWAGLIAAAVVGSVALLTWIGGSQPGPEPAPSAANGSRLLRLTALRGLEVEPAASPSGDRVAYSWSEDGPETANLYVAVLGGSAPLQLTSGACDHHAAWSPDGRQIAFARFFDDGRPCEIRVISALGGPQRRLIECEASVIFGLDWSPDGRRLVYTERRNWESPSRIRELDLETLARRDLTSPAKGTHGDFWASFSPDGSRLAFVRSPARGIKDVWTMSPDGTGLTRHTFDDVDLYGLDWAPDGRHIVFSSDRGGARGLWRVPVDGGEPEALPALAGDPAAPDVLPDGSIAVEMRQFEATVRRLDLLSPQADPVPVITSTRIDWDPAPSPDGGSIAFASDRTGTAEIWTADAVGGGATRRTTFGGPAVASPSWSPDGRFLAFEAHQRRSSDIWVLDIGAVHPRRITEHPAEDVDPIWSGDGNWVYFTSNREDGWQIWRCDTEGHGLRRITREGGSSPRLSPDGVHLYYVHPDTGELWRIPAAGTGPATRLEGAPRPVAGNYAVAADALYLVRHLYEHGLTLVRFDLASRATREIAPLPELLHASRLGLSPDGRHLFFSRLDRLESDIAVVSFDGA